MAFIFSADRIAQMRRKPDQVYATLILPSEGVGLRRRLRKGYATRFLWKEFVRHDENGEAIGVDRSLVVENVDGKSMAFPITVVYATTVDVYGGAGLDQPLASACGFKTMGAMREAWIARHPRSPYATAAYFALGDWRDRDKYLQRNIWRGGDYTSSPSEAIDDLPVLEPDVLSEMARTNHQRHVRRLADAQSSEELADRMARLEEVQENERAKIKHEARGVAGG